MNWLGKLIQKEVKPSDSVLDLGCGIMQATLDHVPTYPKTRLKCRYLVGVDIYGPYLDWLEENYPEIQLIQWDLRNRPLPFKDDGFDIVLLTDILEHLPSFKDVEEVLKEANRIARKKIIICTPRIFWSNDEALESYDLGYNFHQKHWLFIDEFYFRERGFKTKRPKGDHRYAYGVKRKNLKILHVNDIAGVGAVMAKYQRRLGHEARTIISEYYNGFRYFDVYPCEVLMKIEAPPIFKGKIKGRSREILKKALKFYRHLKFCFKCWRYANKWKPDIMHIHGLFMFPIFVSFRKKLIEWHGTMMRLRYENGEKNPDRKVPLWLLRLYNAIGIPQFYSTKELKASIPFPSEQIYNPVDIEHFNPLKKTYKELNNKVLFVINHYEKRLLTRPLRLIQRYFKSMGLEIDIQDRRKNKDLILHKDYPDFLGRYAYFIDRLRISSFSKTALEALAMNLAVLKSGQLWRGLPDEHRPENVAQNTIRIYKRIMEGRYEA